MRDEGCDSSGKRVREREKQRRSHRTWFLPASDGLVRLFFPLRLTFYSFWVIVLGVFVIPFLFWLPSFLSIPCSTAWNHCCYCQLQNRGNVVQSDEVNPLASSPRLLSMFVAYHTHLGTLTGSRTNYWEKKQGRFGEEIQ